MLERVWLRQTRGGERVGAGRLACVRQGVRRGWERGVWPEAGRRAPGEAGGQRDLGRQVVILP